MLGRAVIEAAEVPAWGVTRQDADLAEADSVHNLVSGCCAGVIHCAGFTDVDGAESAPEAAVRDNVLATENLASACASHDIPLLVVSTDYVFDGTAVRPYLESDEPRPLGVYARTKLNAELAARRIHPTGTRIVRTAWLYGRGGRHFPGTILRAAAGGSELRVVDDQKGCPTWTRALAPALLEVLARGEPGIYHAACEGSATWFDFAEAALELAGVRSRLARCATVDQARPAPRPPYGVLNCGKLAALRGRALPHWKDALAEFLAQDGPSRVGQ